MRIALVSAHASPLAVSGGDAGGLNVYVARLAEQLAARGHDVTVHTRRDDPGLPDRVVLPGGVVVEHVPAGPPETLPADTLAAHTAAFGAHLARAWARARPDVVHAHFWLSGLAAPTGVRPHGTPLVQTFHTLAADPRRRADGEYTEDTEDTEDPGRPERAAAERRLGRTCGRALATATDEADALVTLGVPARRVSVVPCGVDAEHFHPAADTGRTPERRQRHRLLACGPPAPGAGYDLAVRALAEVPDAELLVAGGPPAGAVPDDPEAGRLTALARRAGVADRVRLLGAVAPDDMPALLRSADLVLCTALHEPFGFVPLEAMACAVPVLATDAGAHRDCVADGTTGRLVAPGDPGALADAVRALLAEERLRRQYGRNGRERVLRHHTWARVADAVERVYRLALPEPSPAAGPPASGDRPGRLEHVGAAGRDGPV
ncbi:glycosyltransferase [Streptomyces parvulus]|uniref:glycosyltransferase n=1 Tax=Streptomyces parvulus TaxID=146923 RepID=UPI00380ACE29